LVGSYDLWHKNGTGLFWTNYIDNSGSKRVTKKISKEESKEESLLSRQTIYVVLESTNESGRITAQIPSGATTVIKILARCGTDGKLFAIDVSAKFSHVTQKIGQISKIRPDKI